VELVRGAISLRHNLDKSFFPRVTTPFAGVRPWLFFNRVTGAVSRLAGTAGYGRGNHPTIAGVLLAITAVAGLVLALTAAPRRRAWASLTLASAGAVLYLVHVRHFPYAAQRAIEVATPLWVMTGAAGLDRLPAVLAAGVTRVGELVRASPAERRVAAARAPLLGALVLAGLAGPAAAANIATVAPVATTRPGPGRTLASDLVATASWLHRVGGPHGANALVVDSDYFSDVWLAYLARHDTRLAYPWFPPNVSAGPAFSLWDGAPRRFAAVGTIDFADGPRAAFVGTNARFRLVDLAAGPTVVATPVAHAYGPERWRLGPARWFADDGEILVLGSCTTGHVELTLAANPALAPLPVYVVGDLPAKRVVVGAGPTDVELALEGRSEARVILHNTVRATRYVDSRRLSLRLLAVRCRAGRSSITSPRLRAGSRGLLQLPRT